jgi:hypothetical protein
MNRQSPVHWAFFFLALIPLILAVAVAVDAGVTGPFKALAGAFFLVVAVILFLCFGQLSRLHGQDWPATDISEGAYRVEAIINFGETIGVVIRHRPMEGENWLKFYEFPLKAFGDGTKGSILNVTSAGSFKRLRFSDD